MKFSHHDMVLWKQHLEKVKNNHDRDVNGEIDKYFTGNWAWKTVVGVIVKKFSYMSWYDLAMKQKDIDRVCALLVNQAAYAYLQDGRKMNFCVPAMFSQPHPTIFKQYRLYQKTGDLDDAKKPSMLATDFEAELEKSLDNFNANHLTEKQTDTLEPVLFVDEFMYCSEEMKNAVDALIAPKSQLVKEWAEKMAAEPYQFLGHKNQKEPIMSHTDKATISHAEANFPQLFELKVQKTINGTNIENLKDNTIIDIIIVTEERIKQLGKIKVKSTTVAKSIIEYEAMVKELVGIMDGREE